jgi:hypothetical protein
VAKGGSGYPGDAVLPNHSNQVIALWKVLAESVKRVLVIRGLPRLKEEIGNTEFIEDAFEADNKDEFAFRVPIAKSGPSFTAELPKNSRV